MKGRPPKPIEQKRRTGNPGGRPLPSSLAVVPPIESESWELTPADALERVLHSGVSWIAETDSPTVALLREAMELHDRAKFGGTIRDVIACQEHIGKLLAQLGFDPTARARLGLAEVRALSKLETLKAKG